jgi:hypothetical protein
MPHMADIRQQHILARHQSRHIVRQTHRSPRVPMVRLPARNGMHPLRLAALEEELPRELHRPIIRFAPAPHEESLAQPARSVPNKEVREVLGCARRVRERVHVRDRARLRRHGVDHFFVAVPDHGYGGSAAGVEDQGTILQREVGFVGVTYYLDCRFPYNSAGSHVDRRG